MNKFISISELSRSLNLINKKNKKPLNHTLRYWEKEFRQIRPKMINKRRYYSSNQVKIIKLIKYLLKEEGMTINGVKNVLNSNVNKLDDYNSYSLKANYYKKILIKKSRTILDKINKIKKNGKKNSH